eukprot:CAMPEP_0172839038 /NCGR_PEP_ID=MMETSP1075-20121228/28286_1 /TAXON_ID=2916 /ORGANISM="Ceratium fusus, Strain PA161109" /LENGTH=415 /DNA_ID=CAMNT_0013682631 /DNA_START=58 /DNA_END=1301 /DNA_ORIENTATION=-
MTVRRNLAPGLAKHPKAWGRKALRAVAAMASVATTAVAFCRGKFIDGRLNTGSQPLRLTTALKSDLSSSTSRWPRVQPAPQAAPLETLLAGLFVPLMLIGLVLTTPFAKDPESAVAGALPIQLARVLRNVPLTWEIYSGFEFLSVVLAAALSRPQLITSWFSEDGPVAARYGPKPLQCMELFGCSVAPGAVRPLVIFVHGGSWSHSRYWMYRLVGRRLASWGFAAAVVGYGQYPGNTVPDMVDDLRVAVGWLRDHATTLGIDASKAVLLGHSSGGHLSALLALGEEGLGLSGVAALSSPMDITDHYNWEQGRSVADISALYPAHGGEAGFTALSPTQMLLANTSHQSAVGRRGTHFFIGHGGADGTVPSTASERFIAALKAAGGTAEYCFWPRLGHFDVLAAFMGIKSDAASEAA